MGKQKIEFLMMKYSFMSNVGDTEAERYYTEYDIEILGVYEDDNTVLIGKGSVYLFLFELALKHEYCFAELFDSTQAALDLGNHIYDWDNDAFSEDFDNLLEEAQTFNYNILYINRIEILPEHQKNGFGKRIIKDIILRFNGCCGLVMLKAFPLQFEGGGNTFHEELEWYKRMKYDEYTIDEKTAQKKLHKFYSSIGFKQYKKTDHFYLSPSLCNKRLDEID